MSLCASTSAAVYPLLIGLLLAIMPATGAQPLSFRHLSQDDGLPANRYNSFIMMDSRQLVWIGSIEGVIRFDGLRFTTYQADRYRPGHIADDMVQSNFFEDAGGDLWFATYTAINRYRRANDRFETLRLRDRAGQLIEEGYHVFHLDRRRQQLWVQAGEEIYRLELSGPAPRYMALPFYITGRRFAVDTTADGAVRRIYSFPWNAGKGLEIITCTADSTWQCASYLQDAVPEGLSGPPITMGGLVEHDTVAWVFSEQGLLRVNPRNLGRVGRYQPPERGSLQLMDGLLLGGDSLLLSSRDEGLWLFDTQRREYRRNWRHDGPQPTPGMASNNLRALYRDRQQRWWVSLFNHGLGYTEHPAPPFRDPLRMAGRSATAVKFILTDKNERIWLGTQGGELVVFSPGGELLQSFSPREGSLPFTYVQHLSRDAGGRIWVLSQQEVWRFEEATNSWQRLLLSPDLVFLSLFHLQNGRRLLMTDKGIMDLHEAAPDWGLRPALDVQREQRLHSDLLFEHSSRHLLLPFNGSGLAIYYLPDEQSYKRLRNLEVGTDIYCFYEDPRTAEVWLGTSSGLKVLSPNFSQVRDTLQAAWQVGHRNVYSIARDAQGRFWFATHQGLWRLDGQEGRLVHFQKEDGLASEDFIFRAVARASDDKLWFGHTEGLAVFRPADIAPYPYPAEVLIDELLVNNVPYAGPHYIGESDSIRLTYAQNNLAFHLTAVGYHLPRRCQLRYRLRGYDDTWTLVDNGDYARFPQVPAGDYRLEVVAINPNGLESQPRTLHIHLPPPFWKTWWFRLSVILLTGFAIIYAVHAYIQRRLRAERLVLERRLALEAERNRIADELHDDMGGGLSAILFQIENVLSQEKESSSRQKLTQVKHKAGELLERMSDIIWALDTQHNSLEELLIYLRRYTVEYLELNQLRYELYFPEEVPPLSLGSEQRRNLLLILKESLHNIVKHAAATLVTVAIDLSPQQLELRISDDGRGMVDPAGRPGGKGLISMRKRAEALQGSLTLHTAPGQGTRIHLQIPLTTQPA